MREETRTMKQDTSPKVVASTTMDLLSYLKRSRSARMGGMIVAVIILVALAAPLITRYGPMDIDATRRLKPPSSVHWLGTDDVGRDVFSRIAYGARTSLMIGALVVLAAGIAGTICGLAAGYFPKLDRVLMRFLDGLMAFPTTLLALALMAALGPKVSNLIIALSVVYVPGLSRVVRSVVLVVRETLFVEASRAMGAHDSRILSQHILPNCMAPIVVQGTFIFAQSILAEASLSFLGVGIPPYLPSWGNILTEGRTYLHLAPWMTVYPGLSIMLSVLGLNLLGDGLRDALDPRVRRSL